MGWQIPPATHETYPRNPLTTVVAQLRFHPILKIDRERQEIVDFQDFVRGRFPVYQEVETRDFRLDPVARTLLERTSVQFRFATEDQGTFIALSKDALAVETAGYQDHESFLDGVRLAVEALEKVFETISPQRLGLRYVNQISRETISRDLGRPCQWADLVTPDLLRTPEQLNTLVDVAFASEITAPIDDGVITLRYGIRKPREESVFMLDIDRYHSGGLALGGILPALEGFSEQCSALFERYRGEALIHWMQSGEVD